MYFHLVYCWDHIACIEKRLDFTTAKVRHANCLCFPGLHHPFHRSPSIDEARLALDHPAICISGESFRPSLERTRIVHQQQVHIRRVQIFQRIIQGAINIVRVVVIAPKFRAYKDLFARDTAVLDAPADLVLDIVDASGVDELHASLQCCGDCILLCLFVLKGAKSESGNFGTRVESEVSGRQRLWGL